MNKLYPDHYEMFGWDFEKDPNHFLVIAERLEKEGQESRARAIRYLVERLLQAEKIAKSK
jgi:repressor of nif and glnA expression